MLKINNSNEKNNELEPKLTEADIENLDLNNEKVKKLMKQYEEDTTKYAIWRGAVTTGFINWLRGEKIYDREKERISLYVSDKTKEDWSDFIKTHKDKYNTISKLIRESVSYFIQQKNSLANDDLNILEPNVVGELVFLIKEEEKAARKVSYYKNPEASAARAQVAPDGRSWFLTGDLATRDENGWYFFVDRKKDSIRRRGENIAAWSIERVINRHDKVLESAAYGIKGSQVGEDYAEDEVMAAVVMKPGETISPEELIDFCQDKLASFQLPRFIEFVEALPKSEVHRIMKRFLKERGVSEKTYDREKAGYFVKRD